MKEKKKSDFYLLSSFGAQIAREYKQKKMFLGVERTVAI